MKYLIAFLVCFLSRSAQTSEISLDFVENIKSKNLNQYFHQTFDDKYTKDFGHIVYTKPSGIFLPETIEKLQEFLPIARDFKIKITCRGKGNSAYGQSQTKGIIIDLKNLNIDLHYSSIDFSSISAPSFKTWFEVSEYIKDKNMTCPVMVDGLDLTVGGTLSFGGLGGSSYRYGSIADNILSLDVMTIDGKVHQCSTSVNPELFEAVLCGIGQFGIIISANISLVPAKKKVNLYKFSYSDSGKFLKEQKDLYTSNVFDHLKGSIKKSGDVWRYNIEAATYYNNIEDMNISTAVSKLSPDEKKMDTILYSEFINSVTNFVNHLKSINRLDFSHPWYNILIPEDSVRSHILLALGASTPYLTGDEPIIIYPMDSNKFKRHLFMKPKSQVFYLLGILYNTSISAEKDYPVDHVLENNRTILFSDAKSKGGVRYLVDATPFTQSDWKEHFKERWETLCTLKQKYDPEHLIGMSIGIF